MNPEAQKEKQEDNIAGKKRLWQWLDRRTGIDSLLHESLDEPIPGGARLAYVFGSILLFLFISQIVTGVFLTLYYVPSADHAHTTVSYIIKEVTCGSFIRSLHAYGSSAVVIVLFLHIAQTFLYGSYKGRRELLWISGCVLAVLMLGMAFSGYLLPWDQKAYFATAVGTNMASEVPFIGSWLKLIMRGGTEMGTLTISRFFVVHVFVLPALIFGFIAAHVFLFRKAGPAGPVTEDPIKPKMPSEPFYPRQVVMDMAVTLVVMVLLGFLSYFVPMELGPMANPADTQYLPRPEWYYLPAFQWLKYWSGPFSVVGLLIIPTLIVIAFVGLPFIDRRLERLPHRRPIALTFFFGGILILAALGFLSYQEDKRDPAIALQLSKQLKETEEFMKTPFVAEPAGISLQAENIALANPQAAKGKQIYERESCNACHGDNGVGTPISKSLIGIGKKFNTQALIAVLQQPTAEMKDGAMPPVELNSEELQALVAYLQSLK
jgi:ubiquinol-cytochrome c reductase cytochrome b subunit